MNKHDRLNLIKMREEERKSRLQWAEYIEYENKKETSSYEQDERRISTCDGGDK